IQQKNTKKIFLMEVGHSSAPILCQFLKRPKNTSSSLEKQQQIISGREETRLIIGPIRIPSIVDLLAPLEPIKLAKNLNYQEPALVFNDSSEIFSNPEQEVINRILDTPASFRQFTPERRGKLQNADDMKKRPNYFSRASTKSTDTPPN
ncbi:24637_t:CDS:2, partial [Gigaspora rosea]